MRDGGSCIRRCGDCGNAEIREQRSEISGLEVGECEAVAGDDFSGLERERGGEHGAGVDTGVKLAALAARVGSGRKIAEKIGVELAASEGGGELTQVDAREARAKAAGDHLAGQRIGCNLPKREKRLESGGRELLFAISSNIFQEEIAKSDGVDAFADGAPADLGHALLVDFIGTWPGERDDPEREPSGGGLRFEDRAAHAVHGDAVELSVERGEQTADLDGGIAAQNVEGPSAVFAAAPGEENALHGTMIAAAAPGAESATGNDTAYNRTEMSRTMKLHSFAGCICGFRSLAWAAVLLLCPPALICGAQDAQAGPAPLRVAIVGVEHGHVEAFLRMLPRHQDVTLVAIVEGDQALAKKYEERFNLSPRLFYPSLEAMIPAQHPQALLVYTSVGAHRKVIETAANYGISVMVEKPLTISLDDALAIRKAAREHHIYVMVNYETTWYASNRAAYDAVAQGQLGAIRRVVVHDGHQGPVEIHTQPEFLSWLTDPAQNGAGALYDFGCYGVDLMTWLMHGESPLTVTAVANHDKPEIYPRVDDDATIVMAYPHARAVIQASWNWPFNRKDMEVYGATGYAITVEANQIRLRLQNDPSEQLITAPPLSPPEDDSLDYLEAVLRGQIESKGDLSALDTNVIVMQVLDAARESVRTGKTVQLAKLHE